MKSLEIIWAIALGFGTLGAAMISDGLRDDYYCETCPLAEEIVAKMMGDFIDQDASVPAHMIRMHFHDCFVGGCDGSILLNSTPGNKAEKDAPPNNPSIRGYELIDQIKEVLEYHCPRVVSCADIITYVARESVHKAGTFERYKVRGGRRDGRISQFSEALANLLPPTSDARSLIEIFAKKGLSLEDMVTLSGAHSIGVTHCSSLEGRHENFNNTGKPDPTLNYSLANKLRAVCPSNGNGDPTFSMDPSTPTQLDNKYYMGLLQNKGLFTSDQTLLTNKLTKKQVVANAVNPLGWEKKFVDAMVKMGEIGVLIGEQGEIRKKCGVVNN